MREREPMAVALAAVGPPVGPAPVKIALAPFAPAPVKSALAPFAPQAMATGLSLHCDISLKTHAASASACTLAAATARPRRRHRPCDESGVRAGPPAGPA